MNKLKAFLMVVLGSVILSACGGGAKSSNCVEDMKNYIQTSEGCVGLYTKQNGEAKKLIVFFHGDTDEKIPHYRKIIPSIFGTFSRFGENFYAQTGLLS